MHVQEMDTASGVLMGLDDSCDIRVEMVFNEDISRIRVIGAALQQGGHDDVRVGAGGGDTGDERVEFIDGAGEIRRVAGVVRADVNQHDVRVRNLREPSEDVFVETVTGGGNMPAAVSLVVDFVTEAGMRIRGLRADVVDVVPRIGECHVERVAVTATGSAVVRSVCDGVAERHDTQRRRLRQHGRDSE